MPRTSTRRTARRPSRGSNPRPLLSDGSILILAGFLVGMAAGDSLPASIRFHAFAAAAVGAVSWLGLRHAKRRRAETAARWQAARAREVAATRLHRHVPVERPRRRVEHVRLDEEQQYVPVPRATPRRRREVRSSAEAPRLVANR